MLARSLWPAAPCLQPKVIAFTLYRASPSEALASLGEASNPAHGRTGFPFQGAIATPTARRPVARTPGAQWERPSPATPQEGVSSNGRQTSGAPDGGRPVRPGPRRAN